MPGAEYGEFVGVDMLHCAKVTADTATEYKTGAIEYIAPAAEIASEVEVETNSTYYDNVAGYTYVSEGVTTLEITVSGIPARKAAEYLGKDYDEATGCVLDAGIPNPPDYATSFRFAKGPSEDYRYYQYLKGKFSGGTEEASSKTNSVDAKTYQLKYTAVVTTHKFPVGDKTKGLKRIFADTTDPNFKSGEAWFSEVQVPKTATVPEG